MFKPELESKFQEWCEKPLNELTARQLVVLDNLKNIEKSIDK